MKSRGNPKQMITLTAPLAVSGLQKEGQATITILKLEEMSEATHFHLGNGSRWSQGGYIHFWIRYGGPIGIVGDGPLVWIDESIDD